MSSKTIIILRNILAVIAGVLIGGIVNMQIVGLCPFPEGVSIETINDNWDKVELSFFAYPFLGHALGTFVGAIIAAFIAANHKLKFALGIGVWFLLGGIAVNVMLQSPIWYTCIDVLLAYIPMAWLGGKLVGDKFAYKYSSDETIIDTL